MQSYTRPIEGLFYVPVPSVWGNLYVGWRETAAVPRVYCVLLPNEPRPLSPSSDTVLPSPIACLCENIRRFMAGEEIVFEQNHLELLALEGCTPFQREVLLAGYAIPRGQADTYKGIAVRLGAPGAARAVGNALARNPFPIVIPCHRVVRSDGQLGGYGGGLEMKRALLALEGVHISPEGIVRGPFYRWPGTGLT